MGISNERYHPGCIKLLGGASFGPGYPLQVLALRAAGFSLLSLAREIGRWLPRIAEATCLFKQQLRTPSWLSGAILTLLAQDGSSIQQPDQVLIEKKQILPIPAADPFLLRSQTLVQHKQQIILGHIPLVKVKKGPTNGDG